MGSAESSPNSAKLLLPPQWEKEYIKRWLDEDIDALDFGSALAGDKKKQANLLMKSEGVLCGAPFINAIYQHLDCQVEWLVEEGDWVANPIKTVAIVSGPVYRILQGERLALNLLSHLSGIATKVARMRKLINEKRMGEWSGIVAGSRKTIPGLRLFQKYALVVGGADPHRYSLTSGCIMLKDNNIDAMGLSISEAIKSAKNLASFTQKIHIETRSEIEAMEAASSGADIIMLDNFSWIDAGIVSAKLKKEYPILIVEVSGGIDESNIVDYAQPSIDVISMGCLTHSAKSIDYSLKIIK